MKKYIKIISLLALVTIRVNSLYGQTASSKPQDSITTIITCHLNQIKHDTMTLILNGPFFSYQLQSVPERGADKILTAVFDKNGDYKFAIKTGKSPFHVTLFLSSRRNEDNYLIGKGDIAGYLVMPGSDINIKFSDNGRRFIGKGSEVFDIQDKIEKTDDGTILDDASLRSSDTKKWLQQKDSLLQVQLNTLASVKAKLNPLAYSIIRADIIGLNRGSVYMWMSFTQPFIAKRVDLTKQLEAGYNELEKVPPYIDLKDNACLSPKYTYYLYEKIKLETKHDRIIAKLPPKIDQNYFPQIKADYSGILRDKLLARWIMDVAAVNNLQPEYTSEALALMQNSRFIDMINRLNSAYQKGQPITDFGFQDAEGHTVHLGDLKGKVIVVDMWFTGCAECISVVKGMPYVEQHFKDRNDVVFVTISIDRNKNMWLKSINPNGGKYYITSTTTYLYTSGTGEKNEFIEKYVPGSGYPQLLIIGKDGKLFSATLPHPINEKLEKEFVVEIDNALNHPF